MEEIYTSSSNECIITGVSNSNKLDQTAGQMHIPKTSTSNPSSGFTHTSTKPALLSAGPSAHIKPDPSLNARKRPLQPASMPDSKAENFTASEEDGSHCIIVGSPESMSPKQKRAKLVQNYPQHSGNRHVSASLASIPSQKLPGPSSVTRLRSLSAESSHKTQPSQSINIPLGGTPSLGEGLSKKQFVTLPSLFSSQLQRSSTAVCNTQPFPAMKLAAVATHLPQHATTTEPTLQVGQPPHATVRAARSGMQSTFSAAHLAPPNSSFSANTAHKPAPTRRRSTSDSIIKRLPSLQPTFPASSSHPTGPSVSSAAATQKQSAPSNLATSRLPTSQSAPSTESSVSVTAQKQTAASSSAKRELPTLLSTLPAGRAFSSRPGLSITAQQQNATGATGNSSKLARLPTLHPTVRTLSIGPGVSVPAEEQSSSATQFIPARKTPTTGPITVPKSVNRVTYATPAGITSATGPASVTTQKQSTSVLVNQITQATTARRTPTTGRGISVITQKQSSSAKQIAHATLTPSKVSGLSSAENQPSSTSSSVKRRLPSSESTSATSTQQGNLYAVTTHGRKSSEHLLNMTCAVMAGHDDAAAYSIPDTSTSTSSKSSTSLRVCDAVVSVLAPKPSTSTSAPYSAVPSRLPPTPFSNTTAPVANWPVSGILAQASSCTLVSASTRPSTLSISNSTQQQGLSRISTSSGTVSAPPPSSQSIGGVNSRTNSCPQVPSAALVSNSQPLNSRTPVSAGSKPVTPVIPNSQPLLRCSEIFEQVTPISSSNSVSGRSQAPTSSRIAASPLPASQPVSSRSQVLGSAATPMPISQPGSSGSQVPVASRNAQLLSSRSQVSAGFRSAATPMPSSQPVSGTSRGLPVIAGRTCSRSSSGTGWSDSPDAASCESVPCSSQPAETPGNII